MAQRQRRRQLGPGRLVPLCPGPTAAGGARRSCGRQGGKGLGQGCDARRVRHSRGHCWVSCCCWAVAAGACASSGAYGMPRLHASCLGLRCSASPPRLLPYPACPASWAPQCRTRRQAFGSIRLCPPSALLNSHALPSTPECPPAFHLPKSCIPSPLPTSFCPVLAPQAHLQVPDGRAVGQVGAARGLAGGLPGSAGACR